MLARLRKAAEENEEGFTLIELLVVVVIIGILAAIAIPTFLNQREKAWAKAGQSDLRNAATVLETYFGEKGSYTGWKADDKDYPTKQSKDVTVTMPLSSATAYCLQAVHAKLDTTNAQKTQHLLSKDGVVADGACPTALP